MKGCTGNCIYPQDLLDGQYSNEPVYADPRCEKHGIEEDQECGCPHCNLDIPIKEPQFA